MACSISNQNKQILPSSAYNPFIKILTNPFVLKWLDITRHKWMGYGVHPFNSKENFESTWTTILLPLLDIYLHREGCKTPSTTRLPAMYHVIKWSDKNRYLLILGVLRVHRVHRVHTNPPYHKQIHTQFLNRITFHRLQNIKVRKRKRKTRERNLGWVQSVWESSTCMVLFMYFRNMWYEK